jgi:predicted RNA-binding Zn ribbon-like protein
MLIPPFREDLCLAYANTLFWRGSAAPTEKLHGFADLMAWLEQSAGLGAAAAQPLKAWAREHPKKAANLFADAVDLRESVFRIFSAFAADAPVRDADFAALRHAIAAAPARDQLARADHGYAWRIDAPQPAVTGLLVPVLWSAGDLMVRAGERRIRQCANEKCLWLFLDASKSGTRRWCDMAACGNRAKAQRHYARIKQG